MSAAPDPDTGTTRTVLLRHDTPGGGHHLDWMIERPGDASEHRLITFRCHADPLADRSTPWEGHRLPDHRAHYLTHEGPIGGGRGSVRRLWSRSCVVLEATPEGLAVRVLVERGVSQTLRLRRRDGDRWSGGPETASSGSASETG
jgi:hypothetical protein